MQPAANTTAARPPKPADPFRRDHADPHAGDLPPLIVDRVRVIHSAAFRRLQFKTQVFLALECDHFRTRLTHTLEVANQARCLAAQLGLNEALAEVVALAHDLGHPPFGHAGERALDECLRADGGFEHNANSLRVIEFLEHPYPEFRGLNLTHVVRECLAKHATQFDHPGAHPLQDGRPAPPEGQVAALADRLTYCLHDLQDGLHAGLLTPTALAQSQLWIDAYTGPTPQRDPNWLAHLRPAVDRMTRRLRALVRAESGRVSITGEGDALLSELEQILLANVYRNEKLVAMDEHSATVVRELYAAYLRDPSRLTRRFVERIPQLGAPRVIGDYISGMTDRFCLDEHARLHGGGNQ